MTVASLKVPPHSVDAEQAVLGALMLDNGKWCDVHDIVLAGDFYRREHRLIFEAMECQAAAGRPIDVITLSEVLSDSGRLNDAGGLDYLGALVTNIHSAANIVAYAQIIRGRATERRLIAVGSEIADLGYAAGGATVDERVERAQALIADLERPTGDEPVALDDCLRDAVNEIERRFDHKGEMLGLATGFDAIDQRTQGLQRGDLVLVAGRPSSGKTTWAMNIAEHAAQQGRFVLVFSLEMSKRQLTMRMLSSIGRIPADRIRKADPRDHDLVDRVTATVARLKSRQMWIDDNSMLTSGQLLSRARRLSRQRGRNPDLIVVDYLQLLTDAGDGSDRVTRISRNLKLVAKEMDCPLVALSQLSRKVEERADKRPILSDLRDSGALEQDADIVFMLYRDEYYNPESPRKGIAEILCRKFRNGEVGEDLLASNLQMCRFDNLAPGFFVPPISAAKRKGGFGFDD